MNKRFQLLSYPLSVQTPMYGNGVSPLISPKKSIHQGDSCNTYELSFLNHSGTHIDGPSHFWKSAKSINDFKLDSLYFNKPCFVSCSKNKNGVICINDLKDALKDRTIDLLIIKTGFQKYRAKDRSMYCSNNPCLAPEAASWLRKTFPLLRGVAIDCISISSCSHRKLGRETHRILLKPVHGRSILIIEDVCIPQQTKRITSVLVAPFYIDGVDSTPCTVIGFIND